MKRNNQTGHDFQEEITAADISNIHCIAETCPPTDTSSGQKIPVAKMTTAKGGDDDITSYLKMVAQQSQPKQNTPFATTLLNSSLSFTFDDISIPLTTPSPVYTKPASANTQQTTHSRQPLLGGGTFLPEHLFITCCAPGMELISLEAYEGQDSYMLTVREGIINQLPFFHQQGYITVATRIKSPQNRAVLYNKNASTKNGQLYPRVYIVRRVKTSCPNSRRACLYRLAHFMNKLEVVIGKRNPNDLHRFQVHDNFDQTPKTGTLLYLQDYITDKFVVVIIKKLFPWASHDWATQEPLLSNAFYRGPVYPFILRHQLGYCDSSTESKSSVDEQKDNHSLTTDKKSDTINTFATHPISLTLNTADGPPPESPMQSQLRIDHCETPIMANGIVAQVTPTSNEFASYSAGFNLGTKTREENSYERHLKDDSPSNATSFTKLFVDESISSSSVPSTEIITFCPRTLFGTQTTPNPEKNITGKETNDGKIDRKTKPLKRLNLPRPGSQPPTKTSIQMDAPLPKRFPLARKLVANPYKKHKKASAISPRVVHPTKESPSTRNRPFENTCKVVPTFPTMPPPKDQIPCTRPGDLSNVDNSIAQRSSITTGTRKQNMVIPTFSGAEHHSRNRVPLSQEIIAQEHCFQPIQKNATDHSVSSESSSDVSTSSMRCLAPILSPVEKKKPPAP